MRALLAAAVVFSLQSLQAQQPRGKLRFTAGAKHIDLEVLDANHPAFITLRAEKNEAAVFREFILAHSGPEKMIAPDSTNLKEQATKRWKVSKHRGTRLIQSNEAVYWCYTPGLVLPVRFRVGNDQWQLQSAELPPLMFVEMP